MHEEGLLPLVYQPLPLGAIRPSGWLLGQLRIQADGLTGHLDEFWTDIAQSGWIGGTAEGWERGPYWLDGLVPLAWLLGDGRLQAKARRWIDYMLEHQHEDGWLGPVAGGLVFGASRPQDPWPVFIILKVLSQYEEATADPRVIPCMLRCLRRMDDLLSEHTLESWGQPGLSSWACSRFGDLLLSIYRLHDRTGESWLLDLANKVHGQGYDWRKHFDDFKYSWKVNHDEMRQWTHVVNNAMAIKQPGVRYRQSKDPGDRKASMRFIDVLDRHHGQATGVFSGDEHYATRNPSQGTETCAVVEYLYSLEVLLSILGEARLGDRLEKIAFNALPAPFKPDMWARQYDQQVNQVQCSVENPPIWGTNGPDSGVYGLATGFGCCTANMHQGWPKYASHLWMRVPAMGDSNDGLAGISFAPCRIETEVAEVRVRVDVATEYPFEETIRIAIATERLVGFPLMLRIPEWARDASIEISGEGGNPLRPEAGAFCRIEREWSGTTFVSLRLPMPFRVERRFNGSASIFCGPLLYSLPIGEDWRQIGGELPHADWEVFGRTPWNYALELDPAKPERSLAFEKRKVGDSPFSPDAAPAAVRVRGRRVPEWGMERGAATPPPASPVVSVEPLEDLVLIPFGCTNLRIGEFPVLAR